MSRDRKESQDQWSAEHRLVHGAWADGSCWSGVIERLQADGFNVQAPQFPESSLAADVARLRQVLDSKRARRSSSHTRTAARSSRPAQMRRTSWVSSTSRRSLSTRANRSAALLAGAPPSPALANMITDELGFAWLAEDDFLHHFAADVEPTRARVMYAVQQPLTLSVFNDVMGAPAWKLHPTWYLVAENDEVIPPDAQRQFAGRMGANTTELTSSHVAMVSHPAEVAALIEEAAATVGEAAETKVTETMLSVADLHRL